MSDKPAADFIPIILHEQAVNAFQKAMGLFVGRGRRFKIPELSKAAGIHPRTLECFKGYPYGHPDHRRLDFGQLLSIAAVLGADFTGEWLRLCDQGAFDLPDDDPNPGALVADASEDAAALARGVQDGKVSQLPQVGARMMTRGAQLVAMARSAA